MLACVLRQGPAEITLVVSLKLGLMMVYVILIVDDGENWNYDPARDGTCQAGISGATSTDGFSQTFLLGMTGRYLGNGILPFFMPKIIAKIPFKQLCLNLDFIIFM